MFMDRSDFFLITMACLAGAGMSVEAAVLEEVLVTARKQSEPVYQVPSSVAVIKGDQLQSANVSHLNQIEKLTSSLVFDATSHFSGSSNSAAVYIRGIGQSDFILTSDPGVGLYVDDVYLPRSIGGNIPAHNIERVEVLKGPQGTWFGKNTIGGAVNIQTKKPGDELDGGLLIRLGEENRRDLEAEIDIPILPGQLLSRWTGAYYLADGYGQRILTGEEQGDEHRWSASGRILWQPDAELVVDLRMDSLHVDEKGVVSSLVAKGSTTFDNDVNSSFLGGLYNLTAGPFITLDDGSNGIYDSRYLTYDPFTSLATGPNYSKLKVNGVSLSVDNVKNQYRFRSISACRDTVASFGRDPDGSPLTAVHTLNGLKHKQYSQEFQLIVDLSRDISWTFGSFYFYENGRERNRADIFPVLLGSAGMATVVSGYFDAKTESYSAYTHADYTFASNWEVSLGARWTEDNKTLFPSQRLVDIDTLLLPEEASRMRDSAVTSFLGLQYRISDGSMTYVHFSEGYKSGGFDGRYIVPTTNPNRYDQETVSNYEWGAKLDRESWKLNVAAFNAEYRDIQVLVIENIAPTTRNAARARVRGAEIDGVVAVGSYWLINGSFAYLDGKYLKVDSDALVSKSNKLINTPRLSGNLMVEYKQVVNTGDNVSLGINYSFRSSVANDAINTPALIQGSVGLWDAGLTYEFAEQPYSVGIYGKNITDETVIVSGVSDIPSFGITEAIYGQGRELGVTLEAEF